jgi:ATP-dependent RNA helicase DHX8/PRP22
MAENVLYSLEVLSLVAKITQEIDNYTGINDNTLAEFVISLHEQSKSLLDFKSQLSSAGAEFPDSFVENVDRLILSLHPKHKKSSLVTRSALNAQTNRDTLDHEKDKQKRLSPELVAPNKEIKEDVLMKEVDDMMAQFEDVAKRATTNDDERPGKGERRDRLRSRSPCCRSPSPDRGRNYNSRRDDWRGRNADERPVLFKIYNGRISSLKDFGAFVQLEGVAGHIEGAQSIWSSTLSC